MPHKYCTRTKTATIPKMNYTCDSSNSDISSISSGSDFEYSDISSENGSDNQGSDNGSDNQGCEKDFNKRDYYKFLHQLYPSRYSKNKYIKEANMHKRAKNAHYENFDISALNTNIYKPTLFNNKIIKKKHKNFYKKSNMNISDDECLNSSEEDEEEEEKEDNNKNS